ncbi:expressed unknown protein [Seminavis robusta]|uniref:Uncharacterized protein n=1 Tax=Seminavis robusta TaxID=568900 RepID=A0A9N8H8S4_9STRA|nr:expressed unknown protein [Seminavis robusta]|eukprot:Sro229_g092920.1 n/a (342) ;mRNA; r:18686-19711
MSYNKVPVDEDEAASIELSRLDVDSGPTSFATTNARKLSSSYRTGIALVVALLLVGLVHVLVTWNSWRVAIHAPHKVLEDLRQQPDNVEPHLTPSFCRDPNYMMEYYDRLSKYWKFTEFLEGLETWVVTHGGTGSGYLVGYMQGQAGINVWTGGTTHNSNYLCHLGNPAMVELVRPKSNKPILVLVGDFYRAFLSMDRRGWLKWNIAKNIFGEQWCELSYHDYINYNPRDPAGIKAMIAGFSKIPNVVFLKAPYTKESVMKAVQWMQLNHSQPELEQLFEGFEVHARQSNGSEVVPELVELFEPYQVLQRIFDEELPGVWNASDMPPALKQYLAHEKVRGL